VIRVDWACDGTWSLLRRNGERSEQTLAADTYTHPNLIILNFNGRRWRRVSVVIPRDRIDAETFRRLYVRLQITRRTRGEPPPAAS